MADERSIKWLHNGSAMISQSFVLAAADGQSQMWMDA